jgi:hypothetical protein
VAITVAELWRYPVKSLRGERLERARVLDDGFEGDRLLRVDTPKGLVTARTARTLLGVPATIGAGGEPEIAGAPWRSLEAAGEISSIAGRGAALTPTTTGKRFDEAPVLLVTDGALAELGEDHRRFRPNIVLTGVEGRAEREWLGRTIRIGSATLDVVLPCERCVVTTVDPDSLEQDPDVLRRINDDLDGIMGMLCRVAEPGEIVVGDHAAIVR